MAESEEIKILQEDVETDTETEDTDLFDDLKRKAEDVEEKEEPKIDLDELFRNITVPDDIPVLEEDEDMGRKKKRAATKPKARKRPRHAPADEFERFGRVRSIRDLQIDDVDDTDEPES